LGGFAKAGLSSKLCHDPYKTIHHPYKTIHQRKRATAPCKADGAETELVPGPMIQVPPKGVEKLETRAPLLGKNESKSQRLVMNLQLSTGPSLTVRVSVNIPSQLVSFHKRARQIRQKLGRLYWGGTNQRGPAQFKRLSRDLRMSLRLVMSLQLPAGPNLTVRASVNIPSQLVSFHKRAR